MPHRSCLVLLAILGMASDVFAAASGPVPAPSIPTPRQGLGLVIGVGVPVATVGAGVLIWWHKHASEIQLDDFAVRDRGWMGENTYAGGHDKIGHLFANYVFQYGVTGMYEAAGYSRTSSIWLAAAVTLVSFNIIELFDGYTHFGWEFGDSVFNLAGQAFAIASQFYGLDSYVQLRMSWLPSVAYQERRTRPRQRIAFLEDYNGQRFFLLANTSGIVDKLKLDAGFLRYLAPAVYFDSRGYRPKPTALESAARQRNVGVAVVLDFSAIAGRWRETSAWARAGESFFRFFQPSVVMGFGYDLNSGRWHAPDATLAFNGRF